MCRSPAQPACTVHGTALMSTHNPFKSQANGAGRMAGRRRPRRTPKGRQVDPRALDEVRALLGERERRRDLLIEHLHLIQDRYGHLSAAHLAALAAEMKLALTEVYEVATFYAHFDVVKEGETPPPPVTVRVCDSLSCAMAGAEQLLRDLPAQARARGAGRARALHGRLRPRAGLRGRPHARCSARRRIRLRRAAKAPRIRTPIATRERFRRLPARGGYALLERLPCRQAHARRPDQDRQRRRPARARRRRLSDRPQMVAGARGAGAAPVRGQCRRRRARHVQGPLLSRARPAPLHRRHADRRLGGRGARHLHLCARRISRGAAPAGARSSPRSSEPGLRRIRSCICAAAPAPISAAKSPR